MQNSKIKSQKYNLKFKNKIYVLGNSLVKEDSLPLKLLPKFRREFPGVTFEEADPNENFVPEEGSIIIDTVQGIKEVRWFDSLDDFAGTKSVSPHDYDLGFHLNFLNKLSKIRNIQILGVPDSGNKKVISRQLIKYLRML
jgi:hypothetical protein